MRPSVATASRKLRDSVMPSSARPWQKLNALTVAIEAAELREPYPKLARLMQSLALQQTGVRVAGARLAFG
jgi:hypothetical protein